jgi:hypothetical protein
MNARKPVPAALKAPPHSPMKAPPDASLPRPRRPAPKADVHGNELMDLFVFFPDLPRPLRIPSPALWRRPLRRYRL